MVLFGRRNWLWGEVLWLLFHLSADGIPAHSVFWEKKWIENLKEISSSEEMCFEGLSLEIQTEVWSNHDWYLRKWIHRTLLNSQVKVSWKKDCWLLFWSVKNWINDGEFTKKWMGMWKEITFQKNVLCVWMYWFPQTSREIGVCGREFRETYSMPNQKWLERRLFRLLSFRVCNHSDGLVNSFREVDGDLKGDSFLRRNIWR